MKPSRPSRAADQRAYRARRKSGMRSWPLLADSVAVEEALILNGWLAPGDVDDPRKVLAAFRQAHMRIEVLPRDAQRRDAFGLCTVDWNQIEDDDR